MLDDRHRVIEMVEQGTPLLVLRRTAKALCVIFQRAPLHQQHVFVIIFQAALELVPQVPRHGGDQSLSLHKSELERSTLAGFDLQRGDFKDHETP